MSLILPKDRNLFLASKIDQDSISKLSKEIIDISEHDNIVSQNNAAFGSIYNPKPIRLHIDSYGGYVYQCFGLLGIIENSFTPVHTIVTGVAMSAGFLVAISGKERYCYSRSTFMYHQLSSLTYGNIPDMEVDIKQSKKLQAMIEKFVIHKTDLSKSELIENYKSKKDWFFSSEEAKKRKIIDFIL